MGNKKKKNSNYVTPKTTQAKLDKEKADKKKRTKKIILTVTAVILAAALVAGAVVAIVLSVRKEESKNFTVTHHASIVIKDYGTLHVELYGEEAPATVANFVDLANSGFYDGLTFHRIIDGYMMQGGKSSEDTDSIIGEFEYNGVENNISHERGVISMMYYGTDYNSATSEFFIVQDSDNADYFNKAYAAFGKVTSGMDIVDAICKAANPIDDNGSILPLSQPIIESISIHAAH